MKVATKFVSGLNSDQETQLQYLMDTDVSRRIRIPSRLGLTGGKPQVWMAYLIGLAVGVLLS